MKLRIFVFLIVIVFFIYLPVVADGSEYESVVTEELYDSLDNTTAEAMEEITADPDYSNNIFFIAAKVIESELANFISPVKCLAAILSVVVIVSFLSSLEDEVKITELAGVLASASVLLPELTKLISDIGSVSNAVGAFLLGSIPVYAGLIVSSGSAAAGAAYGSVTLGLANIISLLAENILIPALSILLGLSLTGPFSAFNISGMIDAIYKPIKWMLTFAVTAFSGMLSIQSFFSSKMDAATLKTAKYIVSSAVPVVGSALGDGVEAIRQSLSLLRAGSGAFGLIAELVIFSPLLISCCGWYLALSAGVAASELFAVGKIKEFLNSVLQVVKMIMAVTYSLFIVSVVSAAVVVCIGA